MRQTFLTGVAVAALAIGFAQIGQAQTSGAATAPGAAPGASSSSGASDTDKRLPDKTNGARTQSEQNQRDRNAQSQPGGAGNRTTANPGLNPSSGGAPTVSDESTRSTAQGSGSATGGAASGQQQNRAQTGAGTHSTSGSSGTQMTQPQGSAAPAQRSGAGTNATSGSSSTTQGAQSGSGAMPSGQQHNQGSASSGTAASGAAQLQPDQENRIRESFASRKMEAETNINFNVSVGATVPQNVRFRRLPQDIVTIVPQYRGYDYVVVRDEIVIIEPKTRRVVHVIERSGRSATGSISRARLSLSDKERTLIRTNARPAYKAKAPANLHVTVGQKAPDTVELEPLPQMIISEAPDVRTYRYFVIEDEVVLVDPQTREVVEIVR